MKLTGTAVAWGHNFHFQFQERHLLGIAQATTGECILLMNTIKRSEEQEQTLGEICRNSNVYSPCHVSSFSGKTFTSHDSYFLSNMHIDLKVDSHVWFVIAACSLSLAHFASWSHFH